MLAKSEANVLNFRACIKNDESEAFSKCTPVDRNYFDSWSNNLRISFFKSSNSTSCS